MTNKQNKKPRKLKTTFIVLGVIFTASLIFSIFFGNIFIKKVTSLQTPTEPYSAEELVSYNNSLNDANIFGIIFMLFSIIFISSIISTVIILFYIGIKKWFIILMQISEKKVSEENKKHHNKKRTPWFYIILLVIIISIVAILITYMITQGNIQSAEITAQGGIEASKPWWERLILDKIGK